MQPAPTPAAAEEAARLESLRVETFTAELLGYGFRPSVIHLLIIFNYEQFCGKDEDRYPFRVRGSLTPGIITLSPDAMAHDLRDALIQAGRDSLRDELAPGYQLIHRWLSRPSGVAKFAKATPAPTEH